VALSYLPHQLTANTHSHTHTGTHFNTLVGLLRTRIPRFPIFAR